MAPERYKSARKQIQKKSTRKMAERNNGTNRHASIMISTRSRYGHNSLTNYYYYNMDCNFCKERGFRARGVCVPHIGYLAHGSSKG